jgi:hypothetical protein
MGRVSVSQVLGLPRTLLSLPIDFLKSAHPRCVVDDSTGPKTVRHACLRRSLSAVPVGCDALFGIPVLMVDLWWNLPTLSFCPVRFSRRDLCLAKVCQEIPVPLNHPRLPPILATGVWHLGCDG